MKLKQSKLSADNRVNSFLLESVKLLKKEGFHEDECKEFVEKAAGILDDIRGRFGEGYEFEYSVRKHFGRIELRIIIPGERFNPFEDGSGAEKRSVEKVLQRQLRNTTTTIYYSYALGKNIISVYSSTIRRRDFEIKSPILWALILGLIAGLACRYLPENVSRFLTDDLADPVFSVIVGMMSGIMGPVMFLSMVLAISSLENIGKLTDLGGKIFRCIIKCTFIVMCISAAVALCFYHEFSADSSDFAAKQIIKLVLDIFPSNFVTPFAENNSPQLVVMGFAMGAALLMLGENASELNNSLNHVNDWMNNALSMVFTLTPVIPFISIFKVFASGQEKTLLNGWEFIVAVYITATICVILKLGWISVRCKVPIPVLWKKTFPLFSRTFVTGSESAAMAMEYEISRDSLGINPSFSAFWIPMSYAMLNTESVIYLIIPSFLISKYTGTPITTSFILTLVILTLELSLASPGTQNAWVILFASLMLPAHYVGIFAVYKMLTSNYTSACNMFYSVLEQIQISSALGEVDRARLENMG